jgi:hypothetical protein
MPGPEHPDLPDAAGCADAGGQHRGRCAGRPRAARRRTGSPPRAAGAALDEPERRGRRAECWSAATAKARSNLVADVGQEARSADASHARGEPPPVRGSRVGRGVGFGPGHNYGVCPPSVLRSTGRRLTTPAVPTAFSTGPRTSRNRRSPLAARGRCAGRPRLDQHRQRGLRPVRRVTTGSSLAGATGRPAAGSRAGRPLDHPGRPRRFVPPSSGAGPGPDRLRSLA